MSILAEVTPGSDQNLFPLDYLDHVVEESTNEERVSVAVIACEPSLLGE